MALPNKELCQRIYLAHKEVLDEIFVSVKEITPQVTSRGSRIRGSTVTLGELVEKDVLSLQDTLYATHRGTSYSAILTRDDAGVVRIHYNEIGYENPSRVAGDITGKARNGWTFWNVRDAHGAAKGSLWDLRQRLALDETTEAG